MSIEPFNPATHGGVLESYRMILRAGVRFLIIGVVALVLAVVLWNLYFRRVGDAQQFFLIGMWVTLIIGVAMTFLGLGNVLDGRSFNSRVRELEKDGKVTRGTIKTVRHRYIILGSTLGTRDGRYSMVMDTGWYYKVQYSFVDEYGRLRKATGLVPDLVGSKRHESKNQQIILDANLPRVGQNVDVLFDYENSAILRIITATT
ncbi:MAG: hypothetical protein FWE45_00780 [Firmicutes bacterium]|nr:hypothetical protein [Bacillota bacterium]